MNTSPIKACSLLVHKFESNICSIGNSSETIPRTHDNDEVKNEEQQKNEMIAASDISTLNKEQQIQTVMGNKILQPKSKITNYTELTDDQIKFLVSKTNFSVQQIREWHQSKFIFLSHFIKFVFSI